MTQLAHRLTPRGELVLRRREDGQLELRANGVFVMDSLEHSSERALASRALALGPAGPLRVLVGGLGLGYTLAAVLDSARVSACTVSELEPDLVAWMRDGTVPHGPPLLADPRVEVVVGDVAELLADADAAYDLILLDVDNGPDHLVHPANAALYRAPALEAARAALSPGGVLVIWSAAPAPALAATLRAVFGEVRTEEYEVPAHGRVGSYWLHLAVVASRP